MHLFSQSTIILSVFASLILTACGGGGGGGSDSSTPTPTANAKPVIAVMETAMANERDAFIYQAQASDSDGSISSYAWQQTDGPAAELIETSSAELSVVLPSVSESQTAVFALTVTDNRGAEASAELTIELHAYDSLYVDDMSDTGLRKCISNLPVEEQDVGLISLNCEELPIASLSDLTNLSKLQSLTIIDTQLSDINGLNSLSTLTHLDLSGNQISDISALSNLSSLETLILDFNEISSESRISTALKNNPNLKTLSLNQAFYYYFGFDFEALNELTSLTSLTIGDVNPTNHAVLGTLVNLETLHLESLGSRFDSLTFLTKLPSLRSLTLKNNSNITDISALQQTTNLESLTLSGFGIEDLSPISSLENITNLTLERSYNYTSTDIDIGVFSSNANIETLKIINYNISNQAELAKLTKLKNLTLQNTDTSSLSGIAELTDLTVLVLSENPRISDISAIGNMHELTYLDISDASNLSDLSPLTTLTKLETLIASNLFYGGIDVSPLKGVTSLNHLDLSRNRLVGTDELGSLGELETLVVNNADQDALFDISVFPKLAHLDISSNHLVNDLTVLGESTSLISLDISSSYPLKTLDGLESFPNLKVLHARNISEISDITALEDISGLEQVSFNGTRLASLESSQSMRPLSGHTGLKELDLSRTKIRNVDGLDELTNLVLLNLERNYDIECTDLAALSASLENTQIEMEDQCVDIPIDFTLFVDEQLKSCIRSSALYDVLDVSSLRCHSRNITDITGVSQFTNATNLSFDRNNITDLTELQNMTQLTSLYFNYNGITEFTGISNLTNLRNVSFNGNDLITTENIVSNLPENSLTQLSLEHNKLVDIVGLNKYSNLQSITLDHNSLTSLSSLNGLPSLQMIRARSNEIDDISGLNNLPSIYDIDLTHNQIVDASTLASLTTLRHIDLYGNDTLECTSLESLEDSISNIYIWAPIHCR